jgi:hypothetical protein
MAHGLIMGSDLSHDEREALTRFLVKVISDVEKVSTLFELRGADTTLTRAAQANLETTLADLRKAPCRDLLADAAGADHL